MSDTPRQIIIHRPFVRGNSRCAMTIIGTAIGDLARFVAFAIFLSIVVTSAAIICGA